MRDELSRRRRELGGLSALAKIEAFKRRMGWGFPWLSSGRSDFNFDFSASFTPQERETGTAFYNFDRYGG